MQCDALMKVDGSSPLREPRRTALALLAIYRHVLSPSAREQAETYHDYVPRVEYILIPRRVMFFLSFLQGTRRGMRIYLGGRNPKIYPYTPPGPPEKKTTPGGV